jgi:hypothetical protein
MHQVPPQLGGYGEMIPLPRRGGVEWGGDACIALVGHSSPFTLQDREPTLAISCVCCVFQIYYPMVISVCAQFVVFLLLLRIS